MQRLRDIQYVELDGFIVGALIVMGTGCDVEARLCVITPSPKTI